MMLEQYLRQATKGVYGTKKQEIMLELRGSLEARIWKLECQGHTPQTALEMALLEMGEARHISAGFIKEYTMPKILKNTVLLGFCAALTLTAVNTSKAQIEVETYGVMDMIQFAPNNTITNIRPDFFESFILQFSSIKTNLEQAGITVDDTPQPALESQNYFVKGNLVQTLSFQFPDSAVKTVLQPSCNYWRNPADKLKWRSPAPTTLESDKIYMCFAEFFRQLKTRSGLPIQIEGWKNPVLRVGKTTLQIGTEKQPANPSIIYASAANQAAQVDSRRARGWMQFNYTYRHAIKVNAPVGTVYALISTGTTSMTGSVTRMGNRLEASIPTSSAIRSNSNFLSLARVNNQGILEFSSNWKILEFSKNPQTIVNDGLATELGTNKHPARALLVRVGNDLSTVLELVPNRPRSAALK